MSSSSLNYYYLFIFLFFFTALDWTKKNAVTPVKNQGRCGSCWAFSTIGAVEGAFAIASGTLLELSMQQVVSCDMIGHGCNGGESFQKKKKFFFSLFFFFSSFFFLLF